MKQPRIIQLQSEEAYGGIRQELTDMTILDLSKLPTASSKFLRSLLPVADRTILASPPPAVLTSINQCGLQDLFRIAPTVSQAVEDARKLIQEAREITTRSERLIRDTQKLLKQEPDQGQA
jgi:hypothetical protein